MGYFRLMIRFLIVCSIGLFVGNLTASPILPLSDPNAVQFPSDNGEHLTFKGIPIDGPFSSFKASMQAEGFEFLGTEGQAHGFSGIFLGQKVTVVAMEGSGTIYRVGVVFEEQEVWSILKGQYLNIKSLLTAKYGDPIDVVEEFQESYMEGGGHEVHYLERDQCTYQSTFQSSDDVGTVQLKLTNLPCVGLIYEDKINAERVANQYIDDL